jgi:hypothetical protein
MAARLKLVSAKTACKHRQSINLPKLAHQLPSSPTSTAPRPAHAFTMFSRSTACRGAQRAARQHALRQTQRRGLAAPASGSFQYQAGEAKGLKFASRDFAGPTTTLALVAKAGTRYQPLPGLTEGLANFAFRVRPLHPISRHCGAQLPGQSSTDGP